MTKTPTKATYSKFSPFTELQSTPTKRPWAQRNEMKKSTSTFEFSYDDNEAQAFSDHVIFLCLDPSPSPTREIFGPLRAINDFVEITSDSMTCSNYFKHSTEKLFFISLSNNTDIIKEAHDSYNVEGIFIFTSNIKIERSRFPKLFGVYTHFEELLNALRHAQEWFEQTQMNFFSFEHEKVFLWSQLWKEEFLNSTNRNASSDKKRLVKIGEHIYAGNRKLLDVIDDFDCSYNKNDALYWCFAAPFPSRFLHHALSTRNTEYIDACRFLIVDVSNVLKQPADPKATIQIFRGIKMTQEFLNKLEDCIGKMICPKGFFTCTSSRNTALELARAPDYRPDLKPVLFKVYCDASVPIGELSMKDESALLVFDAYTAFRVKWVTMARVSVVDLEPAIEDSKSMVQQYTAKFKSSKIANLLEKLIPTPKGPPRLPQIKPAPPTPPERKNMQQTQRQQKAPPESYIDKSASPSYKQGGQYASRKNEPLYLSDDGTRWYSTNKGDLSNRSHKSEPSNSPYKRDLLNQTYKNSSSTITKKNLLLANSAKVNQSLPSNKGGISQTPNTMPKISPRKANPQINDEEKVQAEKMIKSGKFDQAIAIYKSSKNISPDKLNALGQLYSHSKGEYKVAIKYHQQALQLQEEGGDDTTGTLTYAGFAQNNSREYTKALEYHVRALKQQKAKDNPDEKIMAHNYIGIANAQWGLNNLKGALDNAHKALKINKSTTSGNEINLALNYAVLANIHHKSGLHLKALRYAQRAKLWLERSKSKDLMGLAFVLNNLGTIQVTLELYDDAQKSFDRALDICIKEVPADHPRRIMVEKNIKQLHEIIKQNKHTEHKDDKPT